MWQNKLKNWFLSEKRDLPWRENPSAYAVWVSEVMLQQTQVSVVIPYFQNWMNHFPTIEALAKAPLEVVIKQWEGLGYYSRARNLHAGAKTVLEQFGGIFPDNPEDLTKIKGIGPYTVGAILSFAFHKKISAVDGNVQRVLSRLFLIEEDLCKNSTTKKIRGLAEDVLPDETPWIFNEALIELGALICTKKAKCSSCPLKSHCEAFKQGKVDLIPFKSKKTPTIALYRSVAALQCGERFLVKKGESGKVMQGLYEFPYFETDEKGLSTEDLVKKLEETFQLKARAVCSLKEVKHTFTKYKAELSPTHLIVDELKDLADYEWLNLKELMALPFSSGHRQILHSLHKV